MSDHLHNRLNEIRMGEFARELLEGRRDPPDPIGKLSPAEAALAPITREWIENEEAWAYFALSLAAGIRKRLARMEPDSSEQRAELTRLGSARERAAKHLDALRAAGALTDTILIQMAEAEGIEL